MYLCGISFNLSPLSIHHFLIFLSLFRDLSTQFSDLLLERNQSLRYSMWYSSHNNGSLYIPHSLVCNPSCHLSTAQSSPGSPCTPSPAVITIPLNAFKNYYTPTKALMPTLKPFKMSLSLTLACSKTSASRTSSRRSSRTQCTVILVLS